MSVNVIYHGHSCVEVHHGPHRIQFDPFYDQNDTADCKAADVNPTHILLSHAHFDHTDDVEGIAKRTKAVIAANYEIATHYEKKGFKTEAMNHGGSIMFPWGKASLTLAFHTSSFPDGTYGGEPAGWVVEIGGKTIYFAGDTALFGDMKIIGELWNIDLACLPIGDRYTMGPKHALLAAQWLKAKAVLPIHYNTWPPIAQDPAAFATQLQAKGIRGLPLKSGEAVEL
jgi:L-ascorbate metabolism protein UlaG (beta-lactamase superfamily)